MARRIGPIEALAVNAFAVRSLARAAEDVRRAARALQHRLRLRRRRPREPYAETARAGAARYYAASKLLGEWFALEAPRALVLRVESLFGSPRELERPARHARRHRGRPASRDATVRVFTDRIVSPSYVRPTSRRPRGTWSSRAPPRAVSLRERRLGHAGPGGA